jgi:hypothetical protein
VEGQWCDEDKHVEKWVEEGEIYQVGNAPEVQEPLDLILYDISMYDRRF